jgi:hypothetical protein
VDPKRRYSMEAAAIHEITVALCSWNLPISAATAAAAAAGFRVGFRRQQPKP